VGKIALALICRSGGSAFFLAHFSNRVWLRRRAGREPELRRLRQEEGEARVIGKERIAAAKIHETPHEEQAASPLEHVATTTEQSRNKGDGSHDEQVSSEDETPATQDPRANDHEQWIVNVRMIDNGRQIDVRVDQPQWDKLKEGDRVQVAYRVGKYTGTVWWSEIK
jgi:hypothetical protein